MSACWVLILGLPLLPAVPAGAVPKSPSTVREGPSQVLAWEDPTGGVPELVWFFLAEAGFDGKLWSGVPGERRVFMVRARSEEALHRQRVLEALLEKARASGTLSASDWVGAAEALVRARDAFLACASVSEVSRRWAVRLESAAPALEGVLASLGPEAGEREALLGAARALRSGSLAGMALDPSEAARGFDGRSAPSPVVLEVAEAVGPPLPGPAKRPKRESLLESIESAVVAEGASEEARKEGGRVLREMMSRSPEDVLKRMVDKKVRLVVIPKDKKLTDLPQAESLKGKKTLDGRSWDDVRGAANIIQKDGSIAVFAGEENLVKDGKTNYPKDYLPVHEWAHSVKDYGLDASGDLSDKKVKEVFETVKKSSGPFPDEYASTTPGEFFAEYTSLWFGTWFPVTNKDGTKPGPKDEAWIKKNAPEMHAILTRLYGPARPMVPEASKGAEASPPVAAKEP